MSSEVQCPKCSHQFAVQASYYGQTIHCPMCGETLCIPRPAQVLSPQGSGVGDFSGAMATSQAAGVLTEPVKAVPVLNYAVTPRYAGFWIRVAASLVDSLVTLIPSLIASAIIPLLGGLLVWFFYKSLCIANWNGYTVGKKLCRIRVVDLSYRPCTVSQAFGRSGAELLSALIFCIGYIMAGFDKQKQALHDKLAKTIHIYE